MKTLHQKPKRRERSELSKLDCERVLRDFARNIDRMKHTSQSFDGDGVSPEGRITLVFSVAGNFTTTADIFEALRVTAGYKLPRATAT